MSIKSNQHKTLALDDELIDMTQHIDVYANTYGGSDSTALCENDSEDNSESDDSNHRIRNNEEAEPIVQESMVSNLSEFQIHDIDTLDDLNDSSTGALLEPIKNKTQSVDNAHNLGVSLARKHKVAFPNGYLKIVTGCMFSGKTSYIIRECKKWQSIGKQVLMINYALDRRYSDQDKVVSHDKYSIDCMMIDNFSPKLTEKIKVYDVILINEGQFFADLRVNVQHWCDEMKKIVVVSGLDGDFMRGKFGEILDLIPDCDDHIKLKAYCSMCKDGTDAVFTWKVKDRPSDCNVVVDIGVDKYVPLCRKHYNQERKKIVMVNKKPI